jgi:hypothetical protein
MKETVFRNADEHEDFVCNSESGVTLGEGRLVFHEWTKLVERVCEHDG